MGHRHWHQFIFNFFKRTTTFINTASELRSVHSTCSYCITVTHQVAVETGESSPRARTREARTARSCISIKSRRPRPLLRSPWLQKPETIVSYCHGSQGKSPFHAFSFYLMPVLARFGIKDSPEAVHVTTAVSEKAL